MTSSDPSAPHDSRWGFGPGPSSSPSVEADATALGTPPTHEVVADHPSPSTLANPHPGDHMATTDALFPESDLLAGGQPVAADFAPAPAPAGPPGPSVRAWPRLAMRALNELLAWSKTLVSAAVYATLIVTFGFQVARVEGLSMAPTLEDQDRLIVNKLAYRLHDPRVGDIVMLLYPEDPDKTFVKRVVAEPGDAIRSEDGHLYRNDVALPDDFIPEEFRSDDTWGPEVVPAAHYFVMGDHRNNSFDSRSWTWAFVPKKYILGKIQLRWWPLGQAKVFEDWR